MKSVSSSTIQLMNCYNKCFPFKTKFITAKKLHNAWLTSGILNSIKDKSKLFKICRLGIVSHYLFKQYRHQLTQVIRYAKTNYHRQIFTESRNNTKKIWQAINELRGNFQNINNVKTLQYDNKVLSDPLDIAQTFSNYFY